MKKKLSLALALVFIFNSVLAFPHKPPFETYAALTSNMLRMNPEASEHLRIGSNNKPVLYFEQSARTDIITLYWDLGVGPGAAFTDGIYVLRYFVESDSSLYADKIELTVHKFNTHLMVNYNVYEWRGGRYVNVADQTHPGFDQNTLDYRVHTIYDPYGRDYIPITEFFFPGSGMAPRQPATSGPVETSPFRVNDRDRYASADLQPYPYNPNKPHNNIYYDNAANRAALGRLSPSFNIDSGDGFSFQYKGRTTHFLWSGNNFYVTTNRIEKGYIYDFQLEYYTTAAINSEYGSVNGFYLNGYEQTRNGRNQGNGSPKHDIFYFFGGFDDRNNFVFPFSRTNDANYDYNTIFEYSNDPHAYLVPPPGVEYDNSKLPLTGDLTVDSGRVHPGDYSNDGEINGMDVRLDMPKTFVNNPGDPNLGRFVAITEITAANANDFNLPLPMEINFIHAGKSEFSFEIRVDDIKDLSNPRVSSGDAVLSDTEILTSLGTGSQDRIWLRVTELTPGLIYTAEISHRERAPADRNRFFAGISNLTGRDGGMVHTFLEYWIVPTDIMREVVVKPYGSRADSPQSGWYTLYSPSDPRQMQTKEANGLQEIMFEIPDTQLDYRIAFSRTGPPTPGNILNVLTGFSQEIWYENTAVPANVGIPKNLTIEDVKLELKPALPDGMWGDLSFTAKWDIGLTDRVRQMIAASPDGEVTIEYKLFYNDRPDNRSDYATVYVTITESVPGGDLTVSYETDEPLLVIKNPVSTLNSRPDPMSPIQNARFYYAEIEFMTDAAHINATTDAPDRVPPDQLRWEDSLFYYPNIYFFQVSAVAWGWVDPFTGDLDLSNKLIESIYTSNEVNITLDDISGFTVPPPLNLTVKAPSPMVLPPDEKPSLEVSWEIPYAAIDKYLSTQYELDPDPRYDLITVNLYFGHYEPYIKKNYYENGLSMPDMAEQRINQSFEIEFVPPGAISYELDVSEAPHGGGFIDLRPYLRLPNGPSSVVVITGIPVDVTSVLLTGLDTNQAYYVFADLAIEQYSQTDYVETKTSPLTGVVTERTYASDNVPRPSEVEPPAPNFWLDPDSVDDTECTLYWDKILPESGQVVIEYEMIRLRDTQMTEADFASKDTDFNAFFNRIANAEKVGWRFNNTDVTPLQILNGRAASNYIYDPTDDPIKFTDKTLTPNQLYFYYLRTVRMVTEQDEDGNDVVKKRVSTWNRVTVTTKPVQAATNLRVESGRQDYDRQTEVIVSFRAGLDPDRRGIDYTFQFQVKEDDGDWFTVPGNSVNAVFLESAGIPGSPDYRFFYKLTGLKPGTSYSVRVRVHDLGTNAFSIWSNVAQFKTDMNQEDYDNEVATDDWLHYLRQLFEKLLRDPYWVAFESPSSLTVVYRPGDMFAGILQITADAQILLYNNNADSVTYYIPAENIRRANDAEKGFKAQYSDMDVLMPPKMLNGNYNDAMIAMAKLLNTKEVSDYFVKVTVTRRTIDGLVDGAPALTKQTRVDIDAVGTVPRIGSIKAWDAGLYEQFAKIVGERIKDPALKKSILDRVKAETQSEEMVRYMESLVREMKNDLMRLIYNQMNSIGGILSSRSFAFQNYDLPLRLVSKGIDPNTNINGYQAQSNAWSPVPVTNYAEGKAISTRVPNTFVFAGRAVNIPGIENVPKGGSISAFTAKYGLEDYLGFSGVNLNAAATRQMVAGCVARMAGAPKSADPIAWVSANLNVQLSSRSANGNVQAQEAAAVVMALYAKKTNTSVDRITIRNFAITSGMALDERYAQSVRAAFEVGILSDPGFRPGGNVTIKGLLDMLAALDSKVKL